VLGGLGGAAEELVGALVELAVDKAAAGVPFPLVASPVQAVNAMSRAPMPAAPAIPAKPTLAAARVFTRISWGERSSRP
jgi:hypothetical protein